MDGSGERGAARFRRRRRTTAIRFAPPALALLVAFAFPSTSLSQKTSTFSEEASAADRHTAFADRGLTTVQGLVVDSEGEPLEAVLVTTQKMGKDETVGLATISDRANGTFQLELPPGRWRLYFHRIGYRPATVRLVIRSAEPVPRLHIRLRDQRGGVAPVSVAMASPAVAEPAARR